MRKGFTLVELIFVIVIIGILAAAAIPQFQNLKQSAEANNVVKTTVDTASSAANVAINKADLEDINITAAGQRLQSLVKVNGKGWTYVDGTLDGTYLYTDPVSTNVVAEIALSGRTIRYGIECDSFSDGVSVSKCKKAWPDVATSPAGTVADPIIITF